MVRRIILSGGGTGGHIYPAVTIAEELSKIEPTDFLFVGSENGLEKDIIPRMGYPITTLTLRGFERKITFENLETLYLTLKSLMTARYILRRFKPDAVVGTGGYVCGPILLAAALSGIPTVIQEQNVVPGITNRILSRFVDKIALGYQEAQQHMTKKNACVFTGNPVRADFTKKSKEESRAELGIPLDHFMMLVTGGSRGAQQINAAMKKVMSYYRDVEKVTICHVTGKQEYDKVRREVESEFELQKYPHLKVIPYVDNMPTVLSAADLAIYRAGAIGLAELTICGVPAILVPYPYATADHQRHNAQVLAKAGAAIVIEDRALTGEKLIKNIELLRHDSQRLEDMKRCSLMISKPDAARSIANLVHSLIR